MARLITIQYQDHEDVFEDGLLKRTPRPSQVRLMPIPQIVWHDGSPFREANIWALRRASDQQTSIQTVASDMSKLLSYANFLEENDIDMWAFPRVRQEQALIQYRGHLISNRNEGLLSPSGATHRMRVAVKFYRFLYSEGLIESSRVLWRERRFSFTAFDQQGFERTVIVNSTNLSIPNRSRKGLRLEDGLTPLTDGAIRQLMQIADSYLPIEFKLMLLLGISCGLRIGTICDLKIRTLFNASPDRTSPNNKIINVGPGASPPVATKRSVTGQITIPEHVYQSLIEYATSERRVKRQAKSSVKDSDLLFLTPKGKPYTAQGGDSSPAIRTLTKTVRSIAAEQGNPELSTLKFHQTRATFATRLAKKLLEKHPVNVVIAFLMAALLHKNEATTMTYIKFVMDEEIKGKAADAYTRDFLGAANEQD